MGDAYKKLSKGGDASLSYRKVLEIDSQYAAAKYKEAKLYTPEKHKRVSLSKLDEALQLDPQLCTGLLCTLCLYWFYHDIDNAEQDYEKYLSLTDITDDVNYENASIIFVAKQ
ncbi:MAG: hypothetical protein ABI045_04370 [Flavobacteriales bacterium]